MNSIKPSSPKRHEKGFTFLEMMVVLAVIAVLAVLLMPALAKAKSRAQRIQCVSFLKQISLGAKQWALQHTNSYPMSVSTNFGGTKEWIIAGETFRHFEVMSNELNTPYVLVCPSDSGRSRSLSFDPTLNNSNVSYFLGFEARDEQPQMILAGDRNIYNGVRPANGVIGLTTNNAADWGPGMHNVPGTLRWRTGACSSSHRVVCVTLWETPVFKRTGCSCRSCSEFSGG